MSAPIDNDNSNESKHQAPEPSIKVSCNFSFSFKSVLPVLKTLASLAAGMVLGASSPRQLPPQIDLLRWQNLLPIALQEQPQLQKETQSRQ